MRKGLLLSAAGLLLAGSWTAYGACTPVLKCASLGYKYSSSECSGNGVACPFDTSKYFCAKPCIYMETEASCTSQCKSTNGTPCTRGGVKYYPSCGSSKCSSGQICNNGTCQYNMSGTHFYCCDDDGYGCDYYRGCTRYESYGDCSSVVSNYKSLGCSPVFQGCGFGGVASNGEGIDYASFVCR